MPVRLLNLSNLKWVSKEEVERSLKMWSLKIKEQYSEVLKVGYFGSYARGDWGVGSDLDIIIIVKSSAEPFFKRPLKFDITDLPVPADLVVYTEEEIKKLKTTKFGREVIEKEVVWI